MPNFWGSGLVYTKIWQKNKLMLSYTVSIDTNILMIELHPLLGDKLGLGCGKAPYINVTDCRLQGANVC